MELDASDLAIARLVAAGCRMIGPEEAVGKAAAPVVSAAADTHDNWVETRSFLDSHWVEVAADCIAAAVAEVAVVASHCC